MSESEIKNKITILFICNHCQPPGGTNKNKGNAKRGISPCLKIWPGDLDLWPWKSIGFHILLRTKYVPSLVKIHWGMLILDYTPWSIIVPNMRAIGPMTSEEFHLQGEVGRTNERMNTITYIGLYINQTNSDSDVIC
jgi:hypothetical protein